MHPFKWIALLGLLLAGCEARQSTVREAVVAAPAARSQPAVPARVASRVPQVPVQLPVAWRLGSGLGQHLIYGRAWVDDGDTSAARLRLVLDGQTWRVHTTAEADSARPLSFAVAADKAHQLPATVEKGADVRYTFQLLDAHGQPRFTRQLRKADFAREVYGTLRTVASAAAPAFLGYWPARRALLFHVNFVRDETDEGVAVLLLLDATTGRVVHKAAENVFMGGCDCYPTLAPDGQTLLAGEELVRRRQPAVSFTRSDRAVAGTRIVNDSTFLVVYESGNPNAPDQLPDNAELISRAGKVRRRFTFHGTDAGWSGGGYSLETEFMPATGTHYLYDGSTRVFTLIPVRQPTALQQLPAAQLQPFRSPQRGSEVRLEFEKDDMPSAALYVDTLTQQLRYANIEVDYSTAAPRE